MKHFPCGPFGKLNPFLVWQTARGVVGNLLHCVTTYGFVPNGLRTYYLQRSQPPLLTQMVFSLLTALPTADSTGRLELLREA